MISITFSPFKCKFSEPFDLVIKNKCFHSIYKGNIVKVLNLTNVENLCIDASFTKIKNSVIKNVHVTGTLVLQDCEIENVTSKEDIYLYNCKRVGSILSQRDIYFYILPAGISHACHYDRIEAKRNVTRYFLVFKPELYFSVKDQSGPRFTLDEYHKYVWVIGDCSKLGEIIFTGNKYPPNERLVALAQNALFNGKVVGGRLVSERELLSHQA